MNTWVASIRPVFSVFVELMKLAGYVLEDHISRSPAAASSHGAVTSDITVLARGRTCEGFRVFISHTNWSADRRDRGDICRGHLLQQTDLLKPPKSSIQIRSNCWILLNRRSNSVFVCLWCPVADVNVYDTSAVNSLVILFLLSAHQMVLKQLYFCDEFIHI